MEKFGINGIIFYNDLVGFKFIVEKFDIDISTNNNYFIKWAKICENESIVEYLIEKGADPDADSIEIERVNYRPYFTARLKPIHIDEFKHCIKWIPLPKKSMKNSLNLHFLLDWKDHIIPEEYDMANVLIRNLDIKYLNGENTGENVKFVIESNQVKIHSWNSNEILPQIIPFSHWSFINYILYMEKDGELCEVSFHNVHDNFTISFDLGILPKKYAFYMDHFNYSSSFYKYDIPENCKNPSTEIFGDQQENKNRGNNVYVYHEGMIGYYSIFTHESKSENSVKDAIENQKIINDYNKYIDNNCKGKTLHYNEREQLAKRIKEYGEICSPYSIF